MNQQDSRRFKPEFLIIPYRLCEDDSLRPLDRTLYGVIYYFSRMRGKKCIASNDTLRHYCNVGSERSIQGALERLENRGYVKRIFAGNKKAKRKSILCLIQSELDRQVTAPSVITTTECSPVYEHKIII